MHKIFKPIASFFLYLYRLLFPLEVKPFARIQIQPGHRLWKWENGEVTAVDSSDYVESATDDEGNTVRKLMVRDGVMYVSALNQKNAERKFRKEV